VISIKALIFGIGAFTSTFVGGQLALKYKNFIKPMIAFCGGTLVAAALIDLLPEASELLKDKNEILPFGIILLSFMLFHFIDKLVSIHGHSHDEDCEQRENVSGKFAVIGLIIHSFLDGVGIGVGFLISSKLGILVATVVVLHDFSDGLNTVTLLLRNSYKDKTAFVFLVLDALAPIAGVLITQMIQPSEILLGYIFSIFAGFFLYIGATDLLPEAHKERNSLKLVFFTILGAGVITVFRFLS